QDTGAEKWMGHRPSMPDSLPVISRSSRFNQVYFAFGHGHLGLSLGAVTGRLIADLVQDRTSEICHVPFRADRF
ncbi:MAG: FAD-binding oxidoreductase, partial [Rhodospirillaceae bacterium]|nr:FAD-binding oxidoreductase [Rhodospirillaceae bacterium]